MCDPWDLENPIALEKYIMLTNMNGLCEVVQKFRK